VGGWVFGIFKLFEPHISEEMGATDVHNTIITYNLNLIHEYENSYTETNKNI